ncbi:MAG TPA: peptidoglycan synthetase [Bacteroidetes bacterium]|nr:peptidoglycan synthetase [Bacteroidota bacterium]
MKRVHLIAVGGAIMHNLAIALKQKGYKVTGSDDAIYDPAKTNLEKAALETYIGWDATRITADIDFVILGMHARKDNIELLEAVRLGLKVMSFPEFIAAESKDKTRVVVAGSHGKTSTTAMIMHVLRKNGLEFDYLVGSSIDGFDLSVKISDAPLIIIEGDEYLTSPLDLRSKFLWYNPHYSIITGIAYDHINVFPTFDLYIDTFRQYIATHSAGAKYYWYKGDVELAKLSSETDVLNEAYDTPVFTNSRDGAVIDLDGNSYETLLVGKHNLQNMQAALLICSHLGISPKGFLEAIADFTGAGRRMEKIVDLPNQVVFRDFAHSPSKLEATTKAVAETYEGNVLAVFELHTFSSLTKDFLPLYRDAMSSADRRIVFYNDAVFAHKKMEYLDAEYVKECFGDVEIINDMQVLESIVNTSFVAGDNILLMSSGTFNKAEFTLS